MLASKQNVRWRRFLAGCAAILMTLTCSSASATPSLVLIIDDIGNNGPLGERAVALPGAVTLAFLPHTPHAARLAEKAATQGKGIMLHAPMANATGAALGPGALTEDMDQAHIQQTLNESLNAIPHVQGINNHMGSALTAKGDAMRWVMEVIEKRGLFFIDSLTNPGSVAMDEAKRVGIMTARRDVFLDNDRSLEGLVSQFQRALDIAQRDGSVVLIGHPYPETLDFLEVILPRLKVTGEVRLTRADQYLIQEAWLMGKPSGALSRLQLRIPAAGPDNASTPSQN